MMVPANKKMEYQAIKTLKKQTEFILRKYEHTRNDDRALVKLVCETFAYDPIEKATSIERIRRWFNERGQYLPTDERVAKKRKMNIEEWRIAMGYPSTQGDRIPPSEKDKKLYLFKSSREPNIVYRVIILGDFLICNCPSFRYRKTCKHILEVENQRKQRKRLFSLN